MTHNIRTRPTTRLAENAPMTTSGRAVRSITKILPAGLETSGEAGSDHLEEDRASVMQPQDGGCEQKQDAERYSADHHRTRDPVRGPERLLVRLRREKEVCHLRSIYPLKKPERRPDTAVRAPMRSDKACHRPRQAAEPRQPSRHTDLEGVVNASASASALSPMPGRRGSTSGKGSSVPCPADRSCAR